MPAEFLNADQLRLRAYAIDQFRHGWECSALARRDIATIAALRDAGAPTQEEVGVDRPMWANGAVIFVSIEKLDAIEDSILNTHPGYLTSKYIIFNPELLDTITNALASSRDACGHAYPANSAARIQHVTDVYL